MNYLLLIIIILGTFLPLSASDSPKTLKAHRINIPMQIDGKLDEAVWAQADIASDFTNIRPNPGQNSSRKTEVRVLYDNEAIYVGAFMYDNSRDSILTQLTERDNFGNTDFFGISLDTYGKANDAFEYIVAATGVQMDARDSANGEDFSWDAVWSSATQVNEDGWVAEMRIPYSAFRFPKKVEQEWKLNFFRRRASINEQSVWSPVDLERDNAFLAQLGSIEGIRDVEPPIRLSISPYGTVYTQHYHYKEGDPVNALGYSFNFGADIKYGINDAFTLDMTLVPDFGQVQSDDQVLNLSPFEIQFSDNRPFFTEGVEIFNRGNLFYSRRVGGSPIGRYDVEINDDTEEMIENPVSSQLYNASKLSGRTENGLGIGIFNAISAQTQATIKNKETGTERKVTTAPLTNYNVLVLDQALKNSSFVSFVNTNVWRRGSDFYNANVTGLVFDLKNNKQSFGISGKGVLSQKYFANESDDFGHMFRLGLSKLNGNFRFGISYLEESPDYDINDLGFLRSPNERAINYWSNYRVFKPFGAFNQGNFWFNTNYRRIVEPNDFTSLHFNGGFWVQSKSFWNFNMWTNYRLKANDYFEPRTPGRFLEIPAFYNIGFWMGSDDRKKFNFETFGFFYTVNEEGRDGYEFGVEPEYRFNDKFSVGLDLFYGKGNNTVGFVDNGDNDEIFVGRRDQVTISNRLGANYTFNNTMSLDLRVRHYWARVTYNQYYELGLDGKLNTTDFQGFHDSTFNQFNIDMNFRWRFAPGSDIILNWKNNISGFRSLEDVDYRKINYKNGLEELGDLEQINSLSMRIIYFIDYNSLGSMF